MIIKYFLKQSLFGGLILLVLIPFWEIFPQNNSALAQIDTINIGSPTYNLTFVFRTDISHVESVRNERNLFIKMDVYNYSDNTLLQTFIDTIDYRTGAGEVEFCDINLDGYKDIDINSGIHNLSPSHSFWLYDSTKNKFYHSEEYSHLMDYSIDEGNKEIESYDQFTGARGGYTEYYKVLNGHLFLFATDYSNLFDFEKKEIVHGVLRTVASNYTYNVIDPNDQQITVFEYYTLIDDSLLLKQKSWLSEVTDIDENMSKNGIYEVGGLREYLKYIRKEIYTYNIDSIKSLKNIDRYQVINNKWIKVKNFN